jgi:phosphoribosylamine-glycine ligase
VIDAQANALDFILRATAAGHDVRWYVPNKPRLAPVGLGLARRVDDWMAWLRWADLVFLSDNTIFMKQLDMCRKRGDCPPIVGATEATAAWELDRDVGMAMFRRKGIAVPKSKSFTDYDAAIAFVKKEDRAFVSKPSGDADKALSYVGKTPEDLVYMLERWKKLGKLKAPFILQEKVSGQEMAVGGWFGPAGFLTGWCENWEFKKLCDGDRGPNCFTPDSEVLTRSGWKYWPEVTAQDWICTLEGDIITYRQPSQVVVGDFDGELVGWKSPTLDVLVTPGHNMYVQDDHYRRPFWFEEAAVSATKTRTVLRGGGRGVGGHFNPPLAALIGAYIADGFCRDRSIVFGNCPKHKIEAFTEIAADAGYSAHLYGKDLYINSVELVKTVKHLGLAHEKRVPDEIRLGSQADIEAFLRGYLAGDGSKKPNGTNVSSSTVSRRLADDLMEMGLKVGYAVSINTRDRREEPPHNINGVLCYNRSIVYDLSFTKRIKGELRPDNYYKQKYSGKVYCVTVPSHVIYVRRNGKPIWIGQTGEQGTILRYVARSRLADSVLSPFAPKLAAAGYVGYVDVNCIIDDAGKPWPLEFTMRPGWPTFNIQQVLHPEDPATWLLDLAQGRVVKPFDMNTIAAGVVMSIPDYPFNKMPLSDVTGIPIYGIKPSMRPYIHPCEMAVGTAPQRIGDKIETAPIMVTAGTYILVSSGTGKTVEEARRHAYQVLDRISLPNSPMYRTDIGQRLRWELPKVQAHGYAKGVNYAAD